MAAKAKQAVQAAPWVSVAVAADRLGLSPDALGKAFNRHARKAPDGGTEANLDGVRARKFGRLWRVQFSAAWVSEGDAA